MSKVLAHIDIPLIINLLVECFECCEDILSTLSFDPLDKHLRGHIIDPLSELALDLLAKEFNVLCEYVLSVPLGETLESLVFLESFLDIRPL